MLDFAHSLFIDHGANVARVDELLNAPAPTPEPEPDRETWGTTPDAVEGQKAMQDLFAGGPRKREVT